MKSFSEWCRSKEIDEACLNATYRAVCETAYKADTGATVQAQETDPEKIIAKYNAGADAISAERVRSAVEAAAAIGGNADALELAAIQAARPQMGVLSPARSGGGKTDMIEAAMLIRAGFTNLVPENVRPRASQLATLKFGDMIRGIEGTQSIRAALSTQTVTNIISNIGNKVALASWRESPATWRSFASIKSTDDLKANTGIRPSWYDNLKRVAPGGEVKHGQIGEETYTWQAYTFSKLYGIARETIINDDANVLSDVIPGLARSALNTLSDLVWAVIMTNAGNFFHTNNSNTQTGGGSVLAAAGLGVAIKQMRLQRTPGGASINIAPRVLVVPPTLEQTGRALLNSQELVGSTTANTLLPSGNPFSTQNITLEVEPRLENGVTHPITGATVAGSATRWYLFAAPTDQPVAVGFLNGNESPTIETFDISADPNKLDMHFRAVHDFGASFVDYRAAQHSAGA